MISAIPDSFHEKLLSTCNWKKLALLMMSVSDLSSEQSAPNLHCLLYHLLICVILWLDLQVTARVGGHSLPEVLHRDTKLSCHLNTSDLTRMGVPTQPFPWWPHQRPSPPFSPFLLVTFTWSTYCGHQCHRASIMATINEPQWLQNAAFNCSSSPRKWAGAMPGQQTEASHVSVAPVIL